MDQQKRGDRRRTRQRRDPSAPSPPRTNEAARLYPPDRPRWLLGRAAAPSSSSGPAPASSPPSSSPRATTSWPPSPTRTCSPSSARASPPSGPPVAPRRGAPCRRPVVDVVVAAQAFHWFYHDAALPEIARVLKPAASSPLAWNFRDDKIPWVRRLGDVIGTQDQLGPERAPECPRRTCSGRWSPQTFKHWQDINRDSSVDLVALALQHLHAPTTSRARPRSRRCSPSTTTSAAGTTACSCPTSPAASARASIDRLGGNSTSDDDEQAGPTAATAPTATCCSSTSAERRRVSGCADGGRASRATEPPGDFVPPWSGVDRGTSRGWPGGSGELGCRPRMVAAVVVDVVVPWCVRARD